jgi:hypothetical protein
MKIQSLALGIVLMLAPAYAQQTTPGAGNANAIALSQQSPMVQSAFKFLIRQARSLENDKLRGQTLDAISNPNTCVRHRANVDAAKKAAILQQLLDQGLVDPHDDATFPGGLMAGVFPPILNDGSACPKLPQAFYSSPGSVFHGHHSYPGGLPVHESNNDISDVDLAYQYRSVYGHDSDGFATINRHVLRTAPNDVDADIFISQDIIVGAPIWHDWAKSIVFQWNADGTEFQELNFGGNGVTDAFGAAGNSKTGGHHIMSIAEAMARGLSRGFVITQACAHSAPTSGNEYKVVNWLRAAAIMAQIDPVKAGFLETDAQGHLRLPALRELGDVDILKADPTQTNVLAEYTLHNLSDADFTYSGPAISDVEIVLQSLASKYGYDPTKASVYNNKFRNPVFSFVTAERLLIIYSKKGTAGVQAELDRLRDAGVI